MKLVHVTIETSNFKEEVDFYVNHVGLKKHGEFNLGDKRIIFLSSEKEDTKIEIIENKDASDAKREFLSLGFQAEDLESKREELLGLGYEVTPIIKPMENVSFFFVIDPAGVSVQFMG